MTCACLVHVHVINKNHPKDGCIHLLLTVLCSEIPLNIEIILTLLVVHMDGIRCTVVGLYHHRRLKEIIHQLWIHIITLFRP